jgi:hypothetical protein
MVVLVIWRVMRLYIYTANLFAGPLAWLAARPQCSASAGMGGQQVVIRPGRHPWLVIASSLERTAEHKPACHPSRGVRIAMAKGERPWLA